MFAPSMPPTPRSARSANPSPQQGFGRKVVRRQPLGRRLRRLALRIVLIALVLPVPFVLAYRFVPPPITPLMVIRSLGDAAARRDRKRGREILHPSRLRLGRV
jgi:hypothetical protein